MKTIGENISEFRKTAGLTQEQLSEKMNVTPQAVSKWECDQSYPDIETLGRLADTLGVSADDIISGKNSMPEVRSSTPEDVERRIIVIHVSEPYANSRTTARIPVKLISSAKNSILNKYVSEEEFDLLNGLIENGTTGTLVDVDAEGVKVQIEVVDYDS